MVNRSAVLIAAAVLALTLVTPARAGDPAFGFGKIPFGATATEVLGMFKEAQATKKQTPYIESIGNYVLEGYFEGGLKRDDSGICFLPKVVQKYVVPAGGQEGLDSLTLYFEQFWKGGDEHRLFMVKRSLKRPDPSADFKEIFDELAGRMDTATGKKHAVQQGRVQSFGEGSHTYYLPALVGVWDLDEVLAFLMVANGPEGPLAPEEVFVSKPGLERYLESCKTY